MADAPTSAPRPRRPVLPNGMRRRVTAPPSERLDRRQLVALARLLLGQALRQGTDAATGVKGHPLKQILLSMGLIGVLVATGVTRAVGPDEFIARIFMGAFVLVGLAIIPDPAEVRERHAEILGSKPVAASTHMAARAVLLFVLALLVGLPFALPGLVAAAWRFGLPAWRVPADVAMLVAGSFALTLVWVQVLLAAAVRVGVERVRQVAQAALLLLIVAISLLASMRLALGTDLVPASLLAQAAAVSPSTWFARFWSGASLTQRAGAVVFVAGALALYARGGLERYGEALHAAPPQATRVRAPWPARVVGALGGAPLLRGLLPGPTAGVAAALLTLSRREEVARLKAGATALLAVAFFVWGFYDPGAVVPFWGLQYFVLLGALDGLDAMRQSAHAEAAWLFRQAPVPPEAFVSGYQWAVAWRYTALPLLLTGVLLARQKPLALGALSIMALFAGARLLTAAGLALRPALPLAQAPRAGQSIASQLLGWLASWVALGGFMVLVLLADYAGPLGALVLLLGSGACLAATFAARALAAARLRALAYEA